MIVGVLAFAVIAAIVIFLTVGLAAQQDRGAKAAGRVLHVRLGIAFHSALWGGPAVLIIATVVHWKWMEVLGGISWAMAVPLMIAYIAENYHYLNQRRKSEKAGS